VGHGVRSPGSFETYAKLAEENNALLFLDVQLARDTVMNQVESLKKYLELPFVHLAIHTEFHVKEGKIPGVDLGTVVGKEIQEKSQGVCPLGFPT
jgi:two-component SAPR family response regulator